LASKRLVRLAVARHGFAAQLRALPREAAGGAYVLEKATVFMQHRVLRKGMGANQLAGSIENVFRSTNVVLVGQNGHWRLGQFGSALILVQVVGISDRECFVITVAASHDQNPAAIVDAVNT
jgi:hypothetical protein